MPAFKPAAFLLVAAAVVAVCHASVASTVFGKEDSDKLVDFVKRQELGDAEAVFRAASILDTLGASLPNTNQHCQSLKALHHNDLHQIRFALAARKLLKCEGLPVSKDAVEAVKSALEDGEEASLGDLLSATAAYVHLADEGSLKIDPSVLQDVVQQVAETAGKRGAFRMDSESDASYKGSGAAWHILALAYKHGRISDDQALLDIITAGEGVATMLKRLDKDQNSPSTLFVSEAPFLETTSEVVVGFTMLAKALDQDLDVTASHTGKLANYFLSQKGQYKDLTSAHLFLSGLAAAAGNSIATPIAAVLEQSVLQQTSGGATGLLTLQVTDVFGRFAAPFGVVAVRATQRGGLAPVLSNHEAHAKSKADDNTEYTFNFFAAKPEPGVYDVEFSIAAPKGSKFGVHTTTRTVKVSTTVSVGELSIEKQGGGGAGVTVKPGSSHPTPIAASDSDVLVVGLEISSAATNKAIKPHQVFARISDGGDGEAFFVLSPSGKRHRGNINLAQAARSLSKSGKHSLTIIVADANLLNPVVWEAATLDLTFASTEMESSSVTYEPLPEIVHQFREPEKRPPQTVSSTFTLLVLAPFPVLLMSLLVIGFNFSDMPSGLGALNALLFVCCLGAIVGLMGAYWFFLSIFDTLKALLVLGAFTALVGNRALSDIQDKAQKTKQE